MNLIPSQPNTSRINPRYFYLEITPSRLLDLAFEYSRFFLLGFLLLENFFYDVLKPRANRGEEMVSRGSISSQKKTRGFEISRRKNKSRDFNTSSLFLPRKRNPRDFIFILVNPRRKISSPRGKPSYFNRYSLYHFVHSSRK